MLDQKPILVYRHPSLPPRPARAMTPELCERNCTALSTAEHPMPESLKRHILRALSEVGHSLGRLMDELGLAKSTEADEETMPRSATPKHAQRHAEPPAMPVRQQPDDWSAKPVGPGWDGGEEHETHGALAALVNPRVPSVTATMNLNLEAYYIGATVAGFMAGQRRQPDIEWGTNYCMQFGEVLAKKVRKKYGL